MLYAVAVPDKGGATSVCNSRAAYEALPEDLRQQITGMKTENTLISSARFKIANPDILKEQLESTKPPTVQPLVRTHPDTGKKAVWFHKSKTERIIGMTPEETQDFLQDLTDRITQPQFCYAHQYKPGDLLIIDDRQSLHKADTTSTRASIAASIACWCAGIDATDTAELRPYGNQLPSAHAQHRRRGKRHRSGRAWTPAQANEIHAAMDRYAVLVFHEQPLANEQHLAFTSALGSLENTMGNTLRTRADSACRRCLPTYPTSTATTNPMGRRTAGGLRHRQSPWHSDSSFKAVPAKPLLRAVRTPSRGGNTSSPTWARRTRRSMTTRRA